MDDESAKPLASYRAEELQRMWVNFFGPDPAYHEARRRFVFKGNAPPRPNKSTVEVEVTQTSWVHSQRYLSNSIATQLAVG
jgi:putative two-component system hydrogenase maturation factor HypX/HoxX